MIGPAPSAPAPATPAGLLGAFGIKLIPWLFASIAFGICIWLAAYFYTEWRWYEELGYLVTYRRILLTKAILFVATFVVVFVFLAANVILVIKLSPIHAGFRHSSFWAEGVRRLIENIVVRLIVLLAFIAGLLAGIIAIDRWDAAILWYVREDWGRTDPYFDIDLGYFMFELPLQLFVHRLLTVVALVTLVATGLVAFVFGGLVPVPPGLVAGFFVRLHLTVLILMCLLLVYWGVTLEHRLLSFSEFGAVTGLGYTDAEASLVAYNITRWTALAAAALLALALWWPVFAVLLAVLVLVALAALLAVRIYPLLFQLLLVDPQEMQREMPYLEDHIAFTRYGYDLEGVERHFLTGEPALPADARETLAQLRLWDPATLRVVFNELQALRSYYDIGDVDADRYVVDGRTQALMVAPREVDLGGVTERWQARRMVYTHGTGLVGAHPNDPDLPRLLMGDLPAAGIEAARRADGRLYFSERTTGYVLARTRTEELTGPADIGSYAVTLYDGEGGIPIGPWWEARAETGPEDDARDYEEGDGPGFQPRLDRLALAIRFLDLRLVLSDLVLRDTRFLMHREVRERAGRATPFLQIGDDAYPAIVDGRVVWIADVYVTSDMMPYSRRIDPVSYDFLTAPRARASLIPGVFPDAGRPLRGPVNFVRASLKVAVDAVDGTVTYYEVGKGDPLTEAWKRAFPEVIRPFSEAPAPLAAHFRYPEDLFAMQTMVWRRYHVEEPETFYTDESVWRVPPDDAFIARRNERATPLEPERHPDLRPVWLLTRFPAGAEGGEFGIVHAFTPRERNVMTGYLVGGSDGDRYGTLTAYQFPATRTVLGPSQAQARMAQDPRVSAWTTLRMQSGSRVSRGDILMVPAGDGIAWVQPLFVQSDESEAPNLLLDPLSGIPELKKVVLLIGDRVLMRDTLDAALAAALDEETDGGTDP
ncbi:hypothetical protein BCF33_2702 [Hasllibacter halocynthiae]|uniref:Uncharacterized protein n=1 Tax=Hasllibacter halocynthiae TaxID=595589 RepID=A0A2T0WZ93_9RHOB|nr:UPF0182 family protein [Hasllibacter halocynthiae]PRY92009.1 hypothetical protein BCF33_2702 [Hasllibacter halocynthiae]